MPNVHASILTSDCNCVIVHTVQRKPSSLNLRIQLIFFKEFLENCHSFEHLVQPSVYY